MPKRKAKLVHTHNANTGSSFKAKVAHLNMMHDWTHLYLSLESLVGYTQYSLVKCWVIELSSVEL